MTATNKTELGEPEPSPESGPALTVSEQQRALFDEQRFLAGKIGEACRYISFGVLAIFYTIETSDTGFASAMRDSASTALWLMALLAVLALCSDYLHYFSGVLSVKQALAQPTFLYDDEWLSYKWRSRFYWLKQIFTGASAAIFIGILSYRAFCH